MKEPLFPPVAHFLALTSVAGNTAAWSIHAAMNGKSPSEVSFLGGLAVVSGLLAIRFAMKEVTAKAKPKPPESSSMNKKDTRPTLGS